MKSGQIAAWHAEHLNFARLLRLLEEQVVCFAQGGEPDYQLMLDIVYYLQHFPDLHHHRYENEVFRRVAEREPGMRPLVTQLLQDGAGFIIGLGIVRPEPGGVPESLGGLAVKFQPSQGGAVAESQHGFARFGGAGAGKKAGSLLITLLVHPN